ncbi:hypothetical protein [Conexibacter woesei]|uniref:ASCH domain-containing protein n=1 Tax=Conexibacter woesei (strain DSM 14684 / CCUG 47730 / CIP 108061 / JCM 11494 / NBRC 100937 / ID131577) TaxID=469383 RepID=D3F2D4_CONWI|nr:hypothetical protein [Conexibacter woesei]ADB52200.1 hypothetical protein Cwoe_3783 [Conexibacter woesei DSM 14684]
MLFRQHLHPGLADGSVTLAFRRWRRPTVKAGGTLRSPIGVLAIDAVDVVPAHTISDDDARRAGAADRAALLRELRAGENDEIHRIAFHHVGADPRTALREDGDLSPEQLDALRARLAQIDARSGRGAWTVATLELIRAHPGTRAGDLAARVQREKLRFKTDVRKLKELGLTESLGTGYRLSPRGEALMTAIDAG